MQDKDADYWNRTCAFALVLVSLYKILLELIQFIGGIQMMHQKGQNCFKFWKNPYVKDPKNWIEVIGTALIIRNAILSATHTEYNEFGTTDFYVPT